MFSLHCLGGGLGETWINHDLNSMSLFNDLLFRFHAFNEEEYDNTAAAARNKDTNNGSSGTCWAELRCFSSRLANLSVILLSCDLKCSLFHCNLTSWLVWSYSTDRLSLSNNWIWDWSGTLGAASASAITTIFAWHTIRKILNTVSWCVALCTTVNYYRKHIAWCIFLWWRIIAYWCFIGWWNVNRLVSWWLVISCSRGSLCVSTFVTWCCSISGR
jgi:hypothetical protein